MKILVLGANGQLGSALMEAGKITHEMVAQATDICDSRAVNAAIEFHRPQAVINCAAFTNVAQAEWCPGEVFAVNARGTYNVAKACKENDVLLAQISSDYVFDGGTYSWPYAENSPPRPIQTYGVSKLASEVITVNTSPKHKIFRTSALFGPKTNKSKGTFLKTIIDKVLQGEAVQIYAHHRISVGYTPHVAKAILQGMTIPGNGIYHAVNRDLTSWHHFAFTAIKHLPNFQELLPLVSIKPIEDEVNEVKRPQYSALRNSLLEPLPPWQDAVEEFMKLNYLKDKNEYSDCDRK